MTGNPFENHRMPMYTGMNKDLADKYEQLFKATKNFLLDDYPPCKSIDGHGSGGNCYCNDKERYDRRQRVFRLLNEIGDLK